MPKVKFYKLQNDGSQKVVAECHLSEDGLVVCEGEETLTRNLGEKGIQNYNDPDGPSLLFKDGLKFLEQLRFNFNSGYLNASGVEED